MEVAKTQPCKYKSLDSLCTIRGMRQHFSRVGFGRVLPKETANNVIVIMAIVIDEATPHCSKAVRDVLDSGATTKKITMNIQYQALKYVHGVPSGKKNVHSALKIASDWAHCLFLVCASKQQTAEKIAVSWKAMLRKLTLAIAYRIL
jgi:hypothetical protein